MKSLYDFRQQTYEIGGRKVPAKATLNDDSQKEKVLRLICHPSSCLKEYTVDIQAGGYAQATVTFYITQEAYNAAINPTHEFSETSEPGADFYRRLAGHKGE